MWRTGIPITFPGTALHEAVGGAKPAWLVPPEDLDALTEAVRRLAADAGERRRLGENAWRFAEAHLDKERILTGFE
ncbi:MAG: hypothetical protein JXR29_08665 [Methylothermaceae bacterium]|nr:hypothetical protein [Methylothermaceae bacterium]